MDIEDFYDQDERRRRSEEVELGMDWHDASGVRYELSLIVDTGELYLMRDPVPSSWVDPFGDLWKAWGRVSEKELGVAVVGWIPDQQRLEQILSDWQQAMGDSDSVGWIAARLAEAGVPRVPPAVGATG